MHNHALQATPEPLGGSGAPELHHYASNMEVPMNHFYALVFTSLFLTGCAGLGQVERVSDLSTDQLRRVHHVRLLDSVEGIDYTSLGKVKGISCKGSWMSGNTKEEGAMTQLKIKAVKVNANAILYPTCSHDASVDWGNNCWESWVCVGEAVLLK